MNPDDVIDRYRIERRIGGGGMGSVYLATHVELGQKVAVKIMHRELLDVPQATERFTREAQAAVKLRGENIGTVIDVGRLASGEPYLVMEYLVGEDLETHLRKYHPLPIAEVVDYALQACAGLAEAHAKGIVHRDVKPPNLFRTARPDGSPLIKVLDFGIAKVRDGDQQAALTRTGTTMGSIPYMAPEQLRSSKSVDARADVWSLGATIYHLLGNHYPFPFESLGDAAVRIWTEPPRPLDARVPAELQAAIFSCLEKDLAQRTPDVGRLARALAPFGGELARARVARVERILDPARATAVQAAASEPRLAAADSRAIAQSTLSGSAGVSTSVAKSPRRGLAAAAIVSGCVAVGVLVLIVRAGSDDESSAAPPTPIVTTPPDAPRPAAKHLAALPDNPWVTIPPAANADPALGLSADRIASGGVGLPPAPATRPPTEAYAMLAYEVSNAQLAAWQRERGDAVTAGAPDKPAQSVPWQVARTFCRERLGGDLPTEAQWEWAARALAAMNVDEMFAFNRLAPRIPGSNVSDRVTIDGASLHDLGGNVREWTSSAWRDDRKRAGSYKVVRGLPLERAQDAKEQRDVVYSSPAHYREAGCSEGPCLGDVTLADVGFRCVRRKLD